MWGSTVEVTLCLCWRQPGGRHVMAYSDAASEVGGGEQGHEFNSRFGEGVYDV